jgi:hypothetical protein
MLSKMDLLTGDVEDKGEHDVGDKNGAGAVRRVSILFVLGL